jgi:capsular exopolysaccharide synthesis family protein
MSSTSSKYLAFATEKEKSSSINLRSLLVKYFDRWPIILASTIAAMILAYGYILITDPIYEIKATLMVNAEKSNSTQQDPSKSVLNKLDLPSSPEIVENELAKLKSARLINKVIHDLDLTVSYKKKKGILYDDLYYETPFKVRMIKSELDFGQKASIAIKITVKDQKTFSLEDAAGDIRSYSFGQILHTDIGTWELDPTKTIAQYRGADIKVTFFEPDKLTAFYQKKIDASLEDKLATAVDITFSTNNKQKGKDIINHLIQVYNDDEKGEKNEETLNTIKFIDQRLASLTGELTGTEKDIEQFKSSNKLTDIASDAKFELDKLQSNDSKLNEINVQLSIVDGIERYVNSPKNNGSSPAIIGISDPSLVSSVERLSQLELQREQMLATTPETNPDFEQLDSQIRSIKKSIKENVTNIKASLTNAKNKLQSFNSTSETSISNLPGREREFITIKRQQSIKENLYVYLLQKKEEVSLNYATTVSNYKVLDNAYSLPSKWPSKPIIFLLALVVGAGIPVAVIYARYLIKGAIVDPGEIESGLQISLFGELTFDDKAPMLTQRKGVVNEQFRALRAKLHDLETPGTKGRVILITSSVSGEGKTFISSNLSLLLSSAGRRAVLLELDLRRSAITPLFKLTVDHLGITDFLRGEAAIDEIIRPSGIMPGLEIISRGTIVTNPSELLENGELAKLINELKARYDDVIIDTPPVHLVADALILSRFSDIALYVIRQGITKRSELKFIRNLIQEAKFPNLQFIFNGVNNKKFGYGYEYDNTYYETQEAL